jgi:hypothetical protein
MSLIINYLKYYHLSPLSPQRGDEAGRNSLKGGKVIIVQQPRRWRRLKTCRNSLCIKGNSNEQGRTRRRRGKRWRRRRRRRRGRRTMLKCPTI